jgi:exopolysaccharide production protein ExoZ
MLFAQTGRIIILSFVLIGLVCLGAFFQPAGAIESTYTNPRLLEFLAGALLARIFGTDLCRYHPTEQLFGSGFIAAILLAASLRFPTLLFGGLSVLIMTAGLLLERHNLMPKVRWLRSLGDASFAIYLFQEFAFMAVGIVDRRLSPAPIHPYQSLLLIKLVSIVTAIGVGIFMWRYFEQPATRILRTAFRRARGEPARMSIAETTA